MNLHQLEIFLAVCDTNSMTQAARALYITQPSVSQAVADLEKEYGVRLFERLNHRLYLTAAGERLRSYGRHILHLSGQAEKDLANLARGGMLRVGASLTIGSYLLPELAAGFLERRPEAELFTLVDNTQIIETQILEDRLDLGIVEGPVSSPDLVEDFLCEDVLTVICGRGHPLAQKAGAVVSDLKGQPFIVRETGSGTRKVFEYAMQAAGVDWKIAGVYNNFEAIKQAVCANMGLAVVSKISLKEELERQTIFPVEVSGLHLRRKFNLIYHRQKYFTEIMREFAAFCKQAAAAK